MSAPAGVGSDAAPGTGAAAVHELGASFGAAFVSTNRGLRHATRREVGLVPLPEAQREVLLFVSRNPGITVGGAAEHLQLAPNTVSTLVRQLEADGFMERSRDLDNRRVVHLTVTERARERITRFSDVRTDVLNRALDLLDDSDRSIIEAAVPALARLALALEALRRPARPAGD